MHIQTKKKIRITKEVDRQLTSKIDMWCMDGILQVSSAYIANKKLCM